MKIIYYYHIPKCGGTTISNILKEMSTKCNGEYHEFNYPVEKFGLKKKLISDYKLQKFIKNINRKTCDIKFVHHHHGYKGLHELAALISAQKKLATQMGNQFQLFTCIRDPLYFQISRLNFLRNSCGMPSLSLEDVIEEAQHHNIMYKYLMYNHPKRWPTKMSLEETRFNETLNLIDNVFTVEQFQRFNNWIEDFTGLQIMNRGSKENKGRHNIKPDSAQEVALREANHLDQFFYDKCKSKETSVIS